MKALSLRARLTVWYTLVLLVVLSLSAALVLWQQERIGLRRVDRELTSLGSTLANVLRDEIRERVPDPPQDAITTIGIRGRALAILDPSGRTLAASWNGLSTSIGGAVEEDRSWTATTATGPWRIHAHPEQIGDQSFVLVSASPLADALRERHEGQEAIAVAIPIAVVLAALGGLWLASVGLRPITLMAARAARISASGVEDLGPPDRDDELGQLAGAFNGLVSRLRSALLTQRQFMADASHELRTPVSVIRSAADVTLGRERRNEDEYREALSIVGEQGRRLTRLVNDMLVLARADTGYPLQRAHLYADDLISECARTLALVAHERGVTIRTPPPVDVSMDGDDDLLRRMLLNVMQNAIQHTPKGQSVAIVVPRVEGRLVIDVINEGPPIPTADRERIFNRFVQLDPARRTSGSGLGLPIARWIAEAHGGTLTLRDSDPGTTTFRISLPLSPA